MTLDDRTLDEWENCAITQEAQGDVEREHFNKLLSPPDVFVLSMRILTLISSLRQSREEISHLREALKQTSVIYYEASSKITSEHLAGRKMFVLNPEKEKIIEDHNRRAWIGIKALAYKSEGKTE